MPSVVRVLPHRGGNLSMPDPPSTLHAFTEWYLAATEDRSLERAVTRTEIDLPSVIVDYHGDTEIDPNVDAV